MRLPPAPRAGRGDGPPPPADRRQTTVTAVIVTATGSVALVDACLDSLRDARPVDVDLSAAVVDNASTDDLVDAIAHRHPWASVHALSTNLGFAAATNVGIERTESEFVLVLNPDTEVPRGAIEALVSVLRRTPGAAAAGPRLVDRAGVADHNAKRRFPTLRGALRHFVPTATRGRSGYAAVEVGEFDEAPVDAVSGSCMMVRRAAIEQVGLLDEAYWMYGEDLDWCRRFGRHGWKVIYCGQATVLHVKHGVTGQHRTLRTNWAFHRAMGRFYRKFDAGHRPLVDGLVYSAVLMKFAASAGGSLLRRTLARSA
ncbi:MAG: hypothetical protein QOE44_649 [Solirubrobacteraceae bacterium]|nr:hypothetical protein [Solirubrobacteraceae bacterium]